MKALSIFTLLILILVSACNFQKNQADATDDNSTNRETFRLVEKWRTDTVIRIPESVLYDQEGGVLYVSCIANREQPEGTGFISKVGLDGNIIDLKWAEGITFPKGLAKVDDKLYVTELNTVAEIDINSGEVTQRFTIDSAAFLNDLSSDANGDLYVSDSKGNSIYRISEGDISLILSEGNNRPNGVLKEEGRLLMTSMGDEVFLSMDCSDHSITVMADSIVHGDGIAYTGIPDHYLVSNWRGKVYMVYPDKTKALLLDTEGEEIQSADIAYSIDLGMLYVPTFNGNNVVAYELIR